MSIEWPNWCRLSLEPDEVIGEHKMLRWFVFKCRLFAIYVHKHSGNDPRTPHDHPATNLSIRLRGRLIEYRPDRQAWHRPSTKAGEKYELAGVVRNPEGNRVVYMFPDGHACEIAGDLPRLRFRRAEDVHRLEVPLGRTAWTIWVRGRCRRKWGYFEPTGWRPARTKHQPEGTT